MLSKMEKTVSPSDYLKILTRSVTEVVIVSISMNFLVVCTVVIFMYSLLTSECLVDFFFHPATLNCSIPSNPGLSH
jgi:hypothetical protein